MKKLYQDRDWLHNQYCREKKSLRIIGRDLGVDPTTIQYWLIKNEIPRREAVGVGLPHNNVILTPELSEFIDGWMLSDLCIFARKQDPQSAKVEFGSKHRDCVIWMASKLAEHGIEQSGTIYEHCLPERESKFSYSYQSRAYQDLLEVRNRWYRSDRKKIVPRDIVLTPNVVRHWFIGDGCLSCPINSRPRIFIGTDGFPEDDVCFLVGMLKDIGIKTSRQKCNSIYIHVRSAQDFLDYIGPCDKGLEHLYYYKWETDRHGPIVYRSSNTLPAPLGGRATEAT